MKWGLLIIASIHELMRIALVKIRVLLVELWIPLMIRILLMIWKTLITRITLAIRIALVIKITLIVIGLRRGHLWHHLMRRRLHHHHIGVLHKLQSWVRSLIRIRRRLHLLHHSKMVQKAWRWHPRRRCRILPAKRLLGLILLLRRRMTVEVSIGKSHRSERPSRWPLTDKRSVV